MFRFIYVDKLTVPIKAKKAFGIAIHQLLKMFFSPRLKNGYKSAESFTRVWVNCWCSMVKNKKTFGKEYPPIKFENSDDPEKYLGLGTAMLKNFYYRNIEYLRSLPRPIVEKPLYSEIHGVKIMGSPDRIQPLENGKTAIIDYKTGWAKNIDIFFYQLQFAFYSYLYLTNAHKLKTGKLTKLALYNVISKDPKIYIPLKEITNPEDIEPITINDLKEVPLPTIGHFELLGRLVEQAKEYVKTVLEKRFQKEKEFFCFGDTQSGTFTPHPGLHCAIWCDYQEECEKFIQSLGNTQTGKRIKGKILAQEEAIKIEESNFLL